MRDVLAAAGVRDAAQAAQRGARHVVFKGADGMEASVPIEKAEGLGEFFAKFLLIFLATLDSFSAVSDLSVACNYGLLCILQFFFAVYKII